MLSGVEGLRRASSVSCARGFHNCGTALALVAAARGIIQHVTPAERLGHELAAARRRNPSSSFDAAWGRAVARALAGVTGANLEDWRAALNATRDAWRSAWERRPVTAAERALYTVVTADGRESLPEGWTGDCERCGQPIIAEPGRHHRGAPRIYCGGTCRRLAHVERLVAA